MKDFKKKTRVYALKNAIAHGGKAVQGAVIAGLFAEGLKPTDMKKYGKDISEIIKEINKLSVEDQKKELDKSKVSVSEREVREGLEELPGASKGVVMRFSPSPSGALHIGHALAIGINFVYVKKYGGKFICRIEDTNPDNIYPKAYKMIEDEVKWLCDNKVKVVVQSERMKIYYAYAEKFIKKGSYVCTCSGDEFREFVKEKKNCPCRGKSVKENLGDWKKMLAPKGFKPGEAVLRFKSDMTDKNPAMRDFPLARINENSHPKQKKKYRVWPLMNLSVTADDIEMKMTHIIRGKDHQDNAKRQEKMYKILGKKYPWAGYIGKWHVEDLKMSTTAIKEGIESGKYSGWNDKNLLTVASLKKQGYKPEAFLGIAEQRGLSEVDKVLSKKDVFEILDNFNK